MTNRVKRALREGRAVFGPIIQAITSPSVVRLMAIAGFDFVYLDMEHGPFTISQIGELCQVARASDIVPIVRPPSHRADQLSRPLDVGALGLLVPHVETADQARAIVQHTRYHPLGRRGFSSRGAHTAYRKWSAPDLMATANEDTLIGVMIESVEGVAQADEIASVPGVDLIVIGRGDLSQDMGLPGQSDAGPMREAVARVLEACRRQSVAVGIICFDEEAACQWLERGVRMLNYSSDVALLTDPAAQVLRDLRRYCGNRGIPTLPE